MHHAGMLYPTSLGEWDTTSLSGAFPVHPDLNLCIGCILNPREFFVLVSMVSMVICKKVSYLIEMANENDVASNVMEKCCTPRYECLIRLYTTLGIKNGFN